MPGILIIAHAPLATALFEVARHAFPDCPERLAALDVTTGMTPEEIETRARALLVKVGNPDVLILTDAVGATPSNVAIRLANPMSAASQVKLLSGVNVPMLWRALGHANDPIDKLLDYAYSGAVDGVKVLSSTRPQNQAQRTGANDQDARQHQQ